MGIATHHHVFDVFPCQGGRPASRTTRFMTGRQPARHMSLRRLPTGSFRSSRYGSGTRAPRRPISHDERATSLPTSSQHLIRTYLDTLLEVILERRVIVLRVSRSSTSLYTLSFHFSFPSSQHRLGSRHSSERSAFSSMTLVFPIHPLLKAGGAQSTCHLRRETIARSVVLGSAMCSRLQYPRRSFSHLEVSFSKPSSARRKS
jgi:hypothetical protein